jgi:hypothetical protein
VTGRKRRSRGSAIGTTTENGGVIVKVTTGKTPPEPKAPTRYALHLRRQAANRIRLERGEKVLPPIRPGNCSTCDGWGVVRDKRQRCSVCGGTG